MNDGLMVVDLIERVPDAEVAIVVARVTERLAAHQVGIDPERVRKLIDGRTGAITRALPPERADWIADVFGQVGVRVRVRPARSDETPAGESVARDDEPDPRTPAVAESPQAASADPHAGGVPAAAASGATIAAAPDASAPDSGAPDASRPDVGAAGAVERSLASGSVAGEASLADAGAPPATAPDPQPSNADADVQPEPHASADLDEPPSAAPPDVPPSASSPRAAKPLVVGNWDPEPPTAWTTWRSGTHRPPSAERGSVPASEAASPPAVRSGAGDVLVQDGDDGAQGAAPASVGDPDAEAQHPDDAGAEVRRVTMQRRAEAARRDPRRSVAAPKVALRSQQARAAARRRLLSTLLAILTVVFVALQWWARSRPG